MLTVPEKMPAPSALDMPLERLAALGVKSLSNAELLSLLLLDEEAGTIEQGTALKQAQSVLANARSLGGLAQRALGEFGFVPGFSLAQAARVLAAGEFGRRVNREAFAKVTVDSPEVVCQLMVPEYRGLNQESVQVLLLNSKRQLLRVEEIYRGSLRASVAHPREIFRPALIHSADAIILTHNHPSGDPRPSRYDNEVTQQIVVAGKTLGIEVADHVIIGALQAGTPPFYSYKQEEKL